MLVSKDSSTDAAARLAELARRTREGDKDAIRALLTTVGPPMVRAIRKLLAPRTPDVEDVAQEAMEAFLAALPSFRGDCSLMHFACRVAVLTALASRRRLELRAQYAADTFEVALEETGAGGPSPAEALVLRGRRAALETLLDELPAPQAEVLILHAVHGFTLEEVAEAVGRPLETVRSRLRLGKQTLRERIHANPGLSEILEVTS